MSRIPPPNPWPHNSPPGGSESCPPDNGGTSGAKHRWDNTSDRYTKAERWAEAKRKRKRRFFDGRRAGRPWASKNGTTIGDPGVKTAQLATPLSLFHRFTTSVSPFVTLPSNTEATTMADAAEHDEELVDYDEEEVGRSFLRSITKQHMHMTCQLRPRAQKKTFSTHLT